MVPHDCDRAGDENYNDHIHGTAGVALDPIGDFHCKWVEASYSIWLDSPEGSLVKGHRNND